MDHVSYIGVGSNLGDRQDNCNKAIEELSSHKDVSVEAISRWRETEAVTAGGETGPRYINGAVKILTGLAPRELLRELQKIETGLGRGKNRRKWSVRTIDLDILFYDDIVFDEADLKIPHPEIEKRLFVLKPLCDIDPTFVHPVLKKSVKELLGGLERKCSA